MHLARFVQFAVVAAALVSGTLAQAAPLSYGKYYDDTSGFFPCGTASSCRINFGQLPPNKLVMVRKLHCLFSSSLPVVFAYLQVSATNGGGPIARNLPLEYAQVTAASNGFYYTKVDTDTQWLIGQGRFQFVIFALAQTGSISGECTLTGELVDPIP